jgi:hypothetical protein
MKTLLKLPFLKATYVNDFGSELLIAVPARPGLNAIELFMCNNQYRTFSLYVSICSHKKCLFSILFELFGFSIELRLFNQCGMSFLDCSGSALDL